MSKIPAVRRMNADDANFSAELDQLLSWESVSDAEVNQRVIDIIAQVRSRGDAAVLELTRQFDGLEVTNFSQLELPQERLQQALQNISPEQRSALETAAERVRRYHEHQRQDSWRYTDPDGTMLGQQVTAIDRAGIYVPGGKATYPSSVLMNAIPAKVAGVQEIIMVVPTPRGEINEMVLAAAAIAGVDRLHHWRSPGRGGAGLRYRKRAGGGQDCRARQHLCGDRQAAGVWPRWHRHDCRPVRDSGGV